MTTSKIREQISNMPWRQKRDLLDKMTHEEMSRFPPGQITYTAAAERVTERFPELSELASVADPHGFGPKGPPQMVEPTGFSKMNTPPLEGEELDQAIKAYQRQHPRVGMSYGKAREVILATRPDLREDYLALSAPPARQ